MKNLDAIKARYLKEPLDRKIGHLASDLFRISAFLENSMNLKAVEDIIEEVKFFIEWMAPDAPYKLQVLLSDMQPKLALSQLYLSQRKGVDKNREELRGIAKKWSLQVLATAKIKQRSKN